MTTALIAAIAMVASDILGTVMVMAEAADRGWLAGGCDWLGWYVSISTTTISVTALSGHSASEKVFVLVFVGAANLIGTKLGQMTGHRLLARFPAPPSAEIVALRAELDQVKQQLADYAAEARAARALPH